MSESQVSRAKAFRELHAPGRIFVVANCWDAGTAKLLESCGAPALATTSAGVAWSHGWPDGNALPTSVLAATVAEIARVISVPLSVDFEGGYSNDPARVAEAIGPLLDAGAIGINLEDGTESPDLMCAKIRALKAAAAKRGADLFVNARTDVYLRGLVPAERAESEAIARGRKYLDAGADGLFVPGVTNAATIRALVAAVPLPVNVLVAPGMPPVAELQSLGVRRVSVGSALTQGAYALVKRAATQVLKEGRYDVLLERTLTHRDLNALLAK